MEGNRLIGSSFSPGREALHVIVRPDRRIEVVANAGAVVEDQPLAAGHVLTLEPEEAVTLTTLLRYAGSFVDQYARSPRRARSPGRSSASVSAQRGCAPKVRRW